MNNISIIADKCTGCTACFNSCPTGAIKMESDIAGFMYPAIDSGLCIDCGKCLRLCPAQDREPLEDTRERAYYGYIDDEQIVRQSSSGGAFTLMAKHILAAGGLVCGAALDIESKELLYKSTDECELDDLRRSKYIASQPVEIFKKVKEELDGSRFVLFCGLPCHVDGLRSYLKKDYDNLVLCDFICGGTASPEFFRQHLDTLEKRYGGKVSGVNFRAKLYGWKEHSIRINFDNGKEYDSLAFFDSFFKGYFEKPYQRDCCYHCQYRLAHASDIIIADYWAGIRKGRANDKGVSMVITNSKKGEEFFKTALKDGGHTFSEMPLEDSDYVFKSEKERYDAAFLKKSEFISLYKNVGFEKAARKTYFKGVWRAKTKRRIRGLLNRILHKRRN